MNTRCSAAAALGRRQAGPVSAANTTAQRYVTNLPALTIVWCWTCNDYRSYSRPAS